MFSLQRFTNFNRSLVNGVKFSTQTFQKYKQSCTDLTKLPKAQARAFINSLEAVISDGDGVLWLNDRAIPGSPEAFNALTSRGKKTFICTNNSTRTRMSLMEKACGMGFKVTVDNIISSSHALAQYLKDMGFDKPVYVIGREGLIKELAAVGIKYLEIGSDDMKGTVKDMMNTIDLNDNVGAVVVGFDEYFSFPKLTKACSYLMKPDCLLLATNTDERYPAGEMILPATGCFVRAIEACAERPAKVMGKPNKEFCAALLKNGLIKPQTTLMVGDRGNTDVLFGYNCGFYTLFVGSGTNSLQDIEKWRHSTDQELHKQVPDFYLPKLGDLMKILND
uniref:Phosphoglycolate phosphatase n=1 Tax=Glossina austeni TaxID=7395 RepID=A0A1A9URX9_GLOAU